MHRNSSNWQEPWSWSQAIAEKYSSMHNEQWVDQVERRWFLSLYLDKVNMELNFVILVIKLSCLLESYFFSVLIVLTWRMFGILYPYVGIHSCKQYSLNACPSPASVLSVGHIRSTCFLPSWSFESGEQGRHWTNKVNSLSHSCYRREDKSVQWMHVAGNLRGVFALLRDYLTLRPRFTADFFLAVQNHSP